MLRTFEFWEAIHHKTEKGAGAAGVLPIATQAPTQPAGTAAPGDNAVTRRDHATFTYRHFAHPSTISRHKLDQVVHDATTQVRPLLSGQVPRHLIARQAKEDVFTVKVEAALTHAIVRRPNCHRVLDRPEQVRGEDLVTPILVWYHELCPHSLNERLCKYLINALILGSVNQESVVGVSRTSSGHVGLDALK